MGNKNMEGKKVLVLALFLVACGCGSIFYFSSVQNNTINATGSLREESWREFQNFMRKFNKTYGQMNELSDRYNIFHDNYLYIQSENAIEWHTYTLGVGPFADMTDEEFAAKYLTQQHSEGDYAAIEEVIDPLPEDEINAIDWCSKGYCNPIRSQQCGDCWAHAATAGIEAAYKQKTGQLKDFSEQQFVDCDKHSYGCNGGWISSAFTHAISKGVILEKNYPYKGKDGSCKESSSKYLARMSKQSKPQASESGLKSSLNHRPTGVSLSASWQHYSGGVYNGKCDGQINHAVLAVGYGSNYFKIRNSWGASWGDHGHILLHSNFGSGYGLCQVARMPVYVVA